MLQEVLGSLRRLCPDFFTNFWSLGHEDYPVCLSIIQPKSLLKKFLILCIHIEFLKKNIYSGWNFLLDSYKTLSSLFAVVTEGGETEDVSWSQLGRGASLLCSWKTWERSSAGAPWGLPLAGVSSGDTLTAELERAPPARPRTLHTLP